MARASPDHEGLPDPAGTVRGFYRLPEERQVRATVVLRGGGMPVVSEAADIGRFRAMMPDGASSIATP